jgi:hypothetical protein
MFHYSPSDFLFFFQSYVRFIHARALHFTWMRCDLPVAGRPGFSRRAGHEVRR